MDAQAFSLIGMILGGLGVCCAGLLAYAVRHRDQAHERLEDNYAKVNERLHAAEKDAIRQDGQLKLQALAHDESTKMQREMLERVEKKLDALWQLFHSKPDVH